MIKFLIRTAIVIASIFSLLVVLLITPIGFKVALFATKQFLPGKLTYSQASGLIIGPMEFKDLKYADKSVSVSARHLKLNWRLSALLIRRIEITEFHSDDFIFHQKVHPVKKEKQPQIAFKKLQYQNIIKNIINDFNENIDQFKKRVQSFRLPFSIVIKKARINNFQFINADNKAVVDLPRLHLNAHFTNQTTDLKLDTRLKLPYKVTVYALLKGNFSKYQLKFLVKNKDVNFEIAGSGNSDEIDFKAIKTKMLDGVLSGSVYLRWRGVPKWRFNITAQKINLSELNKSYPKSLNAIFETAGELQTPYPSFSFITKIQTADSKININAVHKKNWNAKWDINIPGLKEYDVSLSGSLQSKGVLLGQSMTPTAKGNLSAQNINYRFFSVNKLQSEWNIDSSEKTNSKIKISADQLKLFNINIPKASFNAFGKLTNHKVSGSLQLNGTSTNFNITGSLRENKWHGRVNQWNWSSRKHGDWHLQKSALITVSNDTWKVTPLCLQSSQHRTICLQGQALINGQWQVKTFAKNFNIKLLSQDLEPEVNFTGNFNMNGIITGRFNRVKTLNFFMKLSPGTLRYLTGNQWITSRYNSGFIKMTFQGKGLISEMNLELPNNDYFFLKASLPNYDGGMFPNKDTPLRGRINSNLSNIGLISLFVPQIATPKGQLKADLNIKGTLNNPIIKGKMNLIGGQIDIPALNLTLKNVTFNIDADNKIINYKTTAISEGQPITISGTTSLTKAQTVSSFKIQGENLLVANTAQYVIYASPDLTITIDGKKIRIGGSITIPKASIKPHDFRNITTMPEHEITYIGKPKVSDQSPWIFNSDVKIIIGKDVQLDTVGIKGKLDGEIQINQGTQEGILATGKIGLRKGTYSAYGHNLTISNNSSIQFNHSPITNPSMQLQATRAIPMATATGFQDFGDQLIVGLNVRGSFKAPRITLFSIPGNLSQSDILSYLLIGQSSNLNSNGNFNFLTGLLEAIKVGSGGLSKSGSIVDDIKSKLGFSELGIESETALDSIGTPLDKQTNLIIGKHITKNFYVRYSRGLYGPDLLNENTLTLRYLFYKSWAIQFVTNSLGNGTNNGADILYTVEKN